MEPEQRKDAGSTRVRDIALSSPAFQNGGRIPLENTRERAGMSPAIHWSEVPEGTRSLALICEDPDAPRPEPFVHWVIYNIPPHSSPGRPPVGGLAGGVSNELQPHEVPGTWQGINDFGGVGYGGPAPPPGHGVHRYLFWLYALDTTLSPRPGMTRQDLLAAMKGHILATGGLVGTYSR